MRIVEVTENKKQYLDLLLLADEQEDMVDRYLYNGKMYVLDDDGVKCECVVTDEGNGILEIKNRRCGRHILRGISPYLRDTTTCSTRSATRRALRSCCRA